MHSIAEETCFHGACAVVCIIRVVALVDMPAVGTQRIEIPAHCFGSMGLADNVELLVLLYVCYMLVLVICLLCYVLVCPTIVDIVSLMICYGMFLYDVPELII